MPKLTPEEIRRHREFLRRQEQYEKQYVGDFFRYLERVYDLAARTIEEEGVEAYLSQIDNLQLTRLLSRIYSRLYRDITIKEAKIERSHLEGESDTKDIIDDLAAGAPFTQGGTVTLWRGLLRDFLQVRIATRISQVTETTVRHITRIIQEELGEGSGPLEIARRIRKFTGFNRNRSIAIARTETATSQNQGKYMAAQSSDLVLTKRWIPTNDGKTRHSHREFLNSPFIDLDAVFVVSKRKGGSETARYPGDSTLSAENTVNCRCGISFRPKRNPDGSLMRRM